MTPTAATTHDLAGRVRVVVVVVDMRFMQQVVSRAHGRCKRAGHAAFPHIHANYTADSVHIYQKAGLPPANVPISWEECLSPEQRVSKFIESVCAERAEFDQLQASYRPVLFRPG